MLALNWAVPGKAVAVRQGSAIETKSSGADYLQDWEAVKKGGGLTTTGYTKT